MDQMTILKRYDGATRNQQTRTGGLRSLTPIPRGLPSFSRREGEASGDTSGLQKRPRGKSTPAASPLSTTASS
jgi:hypothetical protein